LLQGRASLADLSILTGFAIKAIHKVFRRVTAHRPTVAAHSQILTEIESPAGFAAGHQSRLFQPASRRTLESDQE